MRVHLKRVRARSQYKQLTRVQDAKDVFDVVDRVQTRHEHKIVSFLFSKSRFIDFLCSWLARVLQDPPVCQVVLLFHRGN
jgi:hypothetical protein